MNWEKWLKFNPYKKLWSLIGGRPWTYIWRDIYHQAEWLIQMLWFTMGFLVGVFFGWKIALIAIGIYTFGYIQGHFHWGKDYQEGQKGN